MQTTEGLNRSPWGLSWRKNWGSTERYLVFLLPLFPFYGRVYDIAWDEWRIGWHLKGFILSKYRAALFSLPLRIDATEPIKL